MNDQAKKVQIRFEYPRIIYICPKCRKRIEFLKKIHGNSLCMKCGQRLDWGPVHDISTETIQATDADEAAWLAKLYYETGIIDEKDRMDIDDWRHELRGEGAELYFLFRDNKAHGKFMRRYAKEAPIYDG